MVDVRIGDQMVPATIDTGAVKTLISASVVQGLRLESYIRAYKHKPLVRGIAGKAYLDSYLKEVPLYF